MRGKLRQEVIHSGRVGRAACGLDKFAYTQIRGNCRFKIESELLILRVCEVPPSAIAVTVLFLALGSDLDAGKARNFLNLNRNWCDQTTVDYLANYLISLVIFFSCFSCFSCIFRLVDLATS